MIIFQFLSGIFIGIFFTSLVRNVLPTEYNIVLVQCFVMSFCTAGIIRAIERRR